MKTFLRKRCWLAAMATAWWLTLASPAIALPPQIEADRLLQIAATEMDKPDGGARTLIVRSLEAAQATGARMPDNFLYHLGRALYFVDEVEASQERLDRYLTTQGSQARYYKEALALLTRTKTYADKRKLRGVWERFEWHDKEAGELRDRKIGLVWQMCNSFFGTWDGRRCDLGSREFAWEEAMERAQSEARLTGKPWRLPTRGELQDAAGYFPIVSTETWTRDEYDANAAYQIPERLMEEALLSGKALPEARAGARPKSTLLRVRLVR